MGERMGEVGETMSGTGESSRFSKLGLQREKESSLKNITTYLSGTGGSLENWWSLWYLI